MTRISSWLRGLDLNQRPLGYEPFSIETTAKAPQTTPRKITASYLVAFGRLWLSLGATSWVIPGWNLGGGLIPSRPNRGPCPARRGARALVVLDPEIMRRPASTEDLAWMECASSHQPLLGHLVQVDR